MKIFAENRPWYADGLAFECLHCGRCCAGPEEGYVWVTQEEIAAISEYLAIPADQMLEKYARPVAGRYSLIEQEGTQDCIFLVPDPDAPEQRTCTVYPVRPAQCRAWPFWPHNLTSPQAWNAAAEQCGGINRGRTHNLDEIQTKLKAATR